MSELHALAVLLVRFVGFAMLVVSLVHGASNILASWHTIHPSFILHYMRKQTGRTTTLMLAGIALIGFADGIATLLIQGL